jgi:hypothetical protein
MTSRKTVGWSVAQPVSSSIVADRVWFEPLEARVLFSIGGAPPVFDAPAPDGADAFHPMSIDLPSLPGWQLAIVQQPTIDPSTGTFTLKAAIEHEGTIVPNDYTGPGGCFPPMALWIRSGPRGAALIDGDGSYAFGGVTVLGDASGIFTFSGLRVSAAGDYTFGLGDNGSFWGHTESTALPAGWAALPLQFFGGDRSADGIVAKFALAKAAKSIQVYTPTPDANVTLSLVGDNPGTISGTLTVKANDGVATFDDVTFSDPGNYRIQASDDHGNTAATMTIKGVLPATTPCQLLVVQQPTVDPATGKCSIVVAVEDALGNIVPGAVGWLHLGVASGPSIDLYSGYLGPVFAVPGPDGLYTFSDLTVTQAGSYTLRVWGDSILAADVTVTAELPASPVPPPLPIGVDVWYPWMWVWMVDLKVFPPAAGQQAADPTTSAAPAPSPAAAPAPATSPAEPATSKTPNSVFANSSPQMHEASQPTGIVSSTSVGGSVAAGIFDDGSSDDSRRHKL